MSASDLAFLFIGYIVLYLGIPYAITLLTMDRMM
jgi:hypothetical protein